MPIFNSSIFNTRIFNTGDEGAVAEEVVRTGGKGDNKYQPVKPTGFQKRKTLTLKKDPKVSERIEQSRQIQAEVAEQLAREFGAESQEILGKQAQLEAIEKMALVDIEREIGARLRKKLRTEEDEIRILLLIAATQTVT